MSGDGAWIDLLAKLWAPFQTEAEPDARTVIDVSGRRRAWRIRFGGDKLLEGDDPWVLSGDLRYLMVQKALADARHLLGVHAAVVAQGEDGLVLAGASRAGKTTLALELIARGWKLVSDDVAVLDPASGRLLPFLKPVSIKDAAAFRTYRALWSVPAWMGEPQGPFLVPATAFPVSDHKPHRPRWLAFVELVPNSPNRLEGVSAAKAAVLLGRHLGRLDPTVLRATISMCGSALSATLVHDRTHTAADALESFAST
ncbi:MAG: hypothetical protein ACRDJV_08765 [Actinomycetota bacterium]